MSEPMSCKHTTDADDSTATPSSEDVHTLLAERNVTIDERLQERLEELNADIGILKLFPTDALPGIVAKTETFDQYVWVRFAADMSVEHSTTVLQSDVCYDHPYQESCPCRDVVADALLANNRCPDCGQDAICREPKYSHGATRKAMRGRVCSECCFGTGSTNTLVHTS
jgi:hypothetical protein